MESFICSACKIPFVKNDMCATGCGHCFHRECIKTSDDCIKCKKPVTTIVNLDFKPNFQTASPVNENQISCKCNNTGCNRRECGCNINGLGCSIGCNCFGCFNPFELREPKEWSDNSIPVQRSLNENNVEHTSIMIE